MWNDQGSTPGGPISRRGDGMPLHPGTGVVPILKYLDEEHLKIVGTGFYITRYGLAATAKHVIEDLAIDDATLASAVVAQLQGEDQVLLRRVRRAHWLNAADVGVIQVDNYRTDDPPSVYMNLRGTLSLAIPAEGTPLVTYAYPENKVLDFTSRDAQRIIRGDYSEGGVLRFVTQPEHPYLRFPHFETSVEVRSGASGAPLFLPNGHIFGIGCRGWDFRGAEHEGDSLSYIAPAALLLNLEVDTVMLPPFTWEAQQLPLGWEGQKLTIRDLARHGVIDVQAI